jgi:hypothetical protein
MAELTNLETKVAEVIGLAQAARGATEKIEQLVEFEEASQGSLQLAAEEDPNEPAE